MRGCRVFSVILLCMACLSTIATASAPPVRPAVIYVNPGEASANPGETLTVNIDIKDAVDLETYLIYLKFKPSVLTLADVEQGSFLPTAFWGYNVWWNYIGVNAISFEPASGSGTLFSVTFHVVDAGYCTLDLFDSATNMPTEFVDGYFETTAQAGLIGHRAWPEHRRFVISRDEDGNQTLSAKVKNLGPTDLYTKVTFELVRDDGLLITLTTDELVMIPEAVTIFTADFGPLESVDAGTYYTSVRVQYSWAGIYWAEAAKAKTFSFSVTP